MKASGQMHVVRLSKIVIAIAVSLTARHGLSETQSAADEGESRNPEYRLAQAAPRTGAQVPPKAGQVAQQPQRPGQGAPAQAVQGQGNQQRPPNSPNQVPAAAPQGGQKLPANPQAGQGNRAPGQVQNQAQGGKALKKNIRKAKRKETTEALAKRRGQSEPGYIVIGGAQLLPAKILRFSYILQNVSGTKGYDISGARYDVGANLNVTANAFAVEYGITDKITFQILVPIIASNDLTIDANKFRRSEIYEEQFQELVEAISPGLIQAGRCVNVIDCREKIESGISLGVDAAVELPTGEKTIIGANVPLRDAADSIIMKAVEPANGKTGLGDITLGIAYNAYTDPNQILTFGMGFRLPTGEYTDVPSAYRAPGSGFTTLGLVLKYDYRLAKPLMFSLSQQSEYHLTKAVRKRTSAIDPTKLNEADPNSDDPLFQGEGDGIANDAPLERKGLGHEGSLRLSYAAGHIHRYLNPLGLFFTYGYKLDSEYHRGGDIASEANVLNTLSYTVNIEGFGLPVRLPVSFSYTHTEPLSGKNLLIATTSDLFQFTGYYKF